MPDQQYKNKIMGTLSDRRKINADIVNVEFIRDEQEAIAAIPTHFTLIGRFTAHEVGLLVLLCSLKDPLSETRFLKGKYLKNGANSLKQTWAGLTAKGVILQDSDDPNGFHIYNLNLSAQNIDFKAIAKEQDIRSYKKIATIPTHFTLSGRFTAQEIGLLALICSFERTIVKSKLIIHKHLQNGSGSLVRAWAGLVEKEVISKTSGRKNGLWACDYSINLTEPKVISL